MNKIIELKIEETKAVVGGSKVDTAPPPTSSRWSGCFPRPT